MTDTERLDFLQKHLSKIDVNVFLNSPYDRTFMLSGTSTNNKRTKITATWKGEWKEDLRAAIDAFIDTPDKRSNK